MSHVDDNEDQSISTKHPSRTAMHLTHEKLRPETEQELRSEEEFIPYLSFSFSELHRGDCTARNGEFRFYQNGSTHWQCNVSSTDGGDEWDGTFSGGEAGYDGGPGFLFAVSPHFHFDISDSNKDKNWVQDYGPDRNIYAGGVGPLETFARLKNIVFYCGC